MLLSLLCFLVSERFALSPSFLLHAFLPILKRIWRNDDPETSAVHFFTSHFFTTLDDEGPEAVSSWTAKKNIDIFKKRFIFIPINESLHWSLCVVVNPGYIENEYVPEEKQSEDQEFPFILFLDSLKAHRKNKVANKVRKWLNYEAKRLGKFKKISEARKEPVFNKDTMEVFDPKGEKILVIVINQLFYFPWLASFLYEKSSANNVLTLFFCI